MKNIIHHSISALLFTGALGIGNTAFAQSPGDRSVTTTTTEPNGTTTESTGTISEFGPEGIVIKTTTSSGPVRYSSEKTTTYVDENGQAVSVKTVKSGLPVTVYYTKIGDRLVASKVVVKHVASETGGEIETTTTTAAGTITEFGPVGFAIKTESSQEPIGYMYGKTTTYVDEDGQTVTNRTAMSGLPVTVYYTKIGGKLMATKVIVHKAAVVQPEVIEKKKTTTTTTTEKHHDDDR